MTQGRAKEGMATRQGGIQILRNKNNNTKCTNLLRKEKCEKIIDIATIMAKVM